MMICVERATLDDYAVLRIQDFSSLLSSGTQALLHIFHRQLEDDVLAMAHHRLQADGVSYLSGICAFLPLTHTPPRQMKLDVRIEEYRRLEEGSRGLVSHVRGIDFSLFLLRRKLLHIFLADSSLLHAKMYRHIFVLSTLTKIVVIRELSIITLLLIRRTGRFMGEIRKRMEIGSLTRRRQIRRNLISLKEKTTKD